jgi:hypothetical protein
MGIAKVMDGQDAYYVALVLDPRFQTLLLDRDLGKVTAPNVLVKWMNDVFSASKAAPDCAAHSNARGLYALLRCGPSS